MSDKTLISRFLDTVGDGSGTKNVNGDYSGAQQIFKIEPPAGELYTLARMIVHIEDSGPITAAAYGALSALGNGIQLRKQDDSGTVIDLTDGVPVLSNLH